MIRWCAYCQCFLQEEAPFTDYSVSHGLCPKCHESRAFLDPARIDTAKATAALYLRLEAAVRQRDTMDALEILDEGLASGLRPMDLAWGVLQPLLYQVGELWSKGELGVADEHRVSHLAEGVLERLFDRGQALRPYRHHSQPDLMLVAADGNTHVLGIRMLELWLCSQGVENWTLLPGLPTEEILRLTRLLRPRILGVSVSLIEQLPWVRDFCIRFEAEDLPQRPELVLGGPVMRLPQLELGMLEGLPFTLDLNRLIPKERRPRRAAPRSSGADQRL